MAGGGRTEGSQTMSCTTRPWGAGVGGHPTMLGERFVDALAYATRVHRGQMRRESPYVAHLLRVAGLVLEDGGTEDEAIGALLHDAAEDQGGHGRLVDIRRRYGDAVADIVDSCTDSLEQPQPPWHARKEQYIEHLPEASPSALRVSLADKVDNVRGLLHELRDAQAGPRRRGRADDAADEERDVCWYYGSLARMFTLLAPGPRADELSTLAAELARRSARPGLRAAAG